MRLVQYAIALTALASDGVTTAAHAPVWEPIAPTFKTMPALPGGVGAVTLTLPLYNVDDCLYYFEMQVGTPPQQVRVALDTASSNIAISTIKSGNHSYYNHTLSSTYKSDGRPGQLRDGMKGVLARERLGLQGDVAAGGAYFIEVTDVSSYGPYYQPMPYDGWFGVGANATDTVGGFPTIVRMLAKLRVLEQPCVSIYTPRGENGHVTFGSQFTQSVASSSHLQAKRMNGLWGFEVEDIKVNGTSISFPTTQALRSHGQTPHGIAALDIVSYFVRGPHDAVRAIAQLANATAFGAEYYTVPCDADLPDVSFWSKDPSGNLVEEYTLTKTELIGRRLNSQACQFLLTTRRSGDVADWVLGLELSQGQWKYENALELRERERKRKENPTELSLGLESGVA